MKEFHGIIPEIWHSSPGSSRVSACGHPPTQTDVIVLARTTQDSTTMSVLKMTKRRLLEVEEELDSTKRRLAVEEELDSTERRLLTRIIRTIKDGHQTSSVRRSMKLVLHNGICRTILTGEEIKGEGDASVKVALVDDSTGNIVNVERESSLNVEIILVKGEFEASERDDWTFEEFQANIVLKMEGKKPLLAGKVRVKLQRGVGVLDNIKLRHHTSKLRPSKFRLGARVFDTFDRARVKEALIELFTVKDFRLKYYRKYKTPSLSNNVCRLIYIRKGGPIDKHLESNKIRTVEDFLIRLLIDPEGLKSIVNLGAKKWDVTVNNARACPDHKRMYCYINYQHKTAVVFNVLGHVLGLYSENQYFTTTMLSDNHKSTRYTSYKPTYADTQELLKSAYKHWENTVLCFDDEDSLQLHLTVSLHQHFMDSQQQHFTVSQDFSGPYYPLVGHDNCYGESSNRHSNSSSQNLMSAMNSARDEDFSSYYDAPMQLSPTPPFDRETYLLDLHDYFFHQNDNVYTSNADEQMNASPFAFVESRGDNIY
ncbi:hypothetical protein BUALT_BualtUnG0060600 [Buddleja alternifolia]|uniref:Uncharacterized protein n=1 Tax=Buddleja alternifolia TaxID=168488 RepID=A0AAV6VZT6_9LAMI|nr:hypothetical protein BUALT_BualtUnG0060600 [Buddleja alternifolia]